ncbi:MAG: carbohydrate ABC transporter permease, partial [Candidatus Fimadaptatus sp.]
SWFNAMIFLRDRTLYPLQLFLRELLILNNSANEASSDFIELSMARDLVKYCTIIVSTVPILLVYPFAQRYFVQGVMIGAVKG